MAVGATYARFYDKRAQYLAKNQLFPTDVRKYWQKTGKEVWQRYEISYSKKYAGAIIQRFLEGEVVDMIFKSTLRNLLRYSRQNQETQTKVAGTRLAGGRSSWSTMRQWTLA